MITETKKHALRYFILPSKSKRTQSGERRLLKKEAQKDSETFNFVQRQHNISAPYHNGRLTARCDPALPVRHHVRTVLLFTQRPNGSAVYPTPC